MLLLLWLAGVLGCGVVSGCERATGVDAPSGEGPLGPAVAHAGELLPRLKLATWNLEWLNRKNETGPVKRDDADYARLRGYAERMAADVIAFQEVDGSEAAVRVFDPAVYQLHVAAQDDPQRTGFAIRRGIPVTVHPDYRALDVGQVRVGADISVEYAGGTLRLLSVHLKSGCFDDPLDSETRDCRKLFAQLPVLEAWIDARAREHVPALVLGDFNRRLFARPDEAFWRELDDADPPESDLWSPTERVRATCWNGAYPDFIDHLVFNRPASARVVRGSFEQRGYDPSDAPYKRVLSDHCPLTITLGTADAHVLSARVKWPAKDGGAQVHPSPTDQATEGTYGLLKGNIQAGKKLFHVRGCPGYAGTRIDEKKGERWFQSEAEALAAGWTRAPNCP